MRKKWLTGALAAFFISGMIPMTLWADTTDSDELTVTDVKRKRRQKRPVDTSGRRMIWTCHRFRRRTGRKRF